MVIFDFHDRYDKAIQIYEAVAKNSLNNNLLKYSVKGYLLNAGLCQICGKDTIAVQNAIENYQVSSPICWLLINNDFIINSLIKLFWAARKRLLICLLLLQELDPTFVGTRECKFLQVFFQPSSSFHSLFSCSFNLDNHIFAEQNIVMVLFLCLTPNVTREFYVDLLQDLAAAIDEMDIVKFTDVVKEFDSMSRLVSLLT